MTNETKLIGILRSLGIQFDRQTDKATNVQCPFCNDAGRHCGIFYSNLRFHCWKCKRKGGLFDLLKQHVGLRFSDYQVMVEDVEPLGDVSPTDKIREIVTDSHKPRKQEREPARRTKIDLPPSSPVTSGLVQRTPDLWQFLVARNLTVSTLEENRVRFCSVGAFAQRLIIPIFSIDGSNLVAYQGRDITGRAKSKYLTSHGVDISKFLYWSDLYNASGRVYLVEGIFDAWRMESDAIASFHKGLSSMQRAMLMTDPAIKELVVAWDADAFRESERAAKELACVMPHVGTVRLPEGQDPDSLGRAAMLDLPIQWM